MNNFIFNKLEGSLVELSLFTESDITQEYISWLNNSKVVEYDDAQSIGRRYRRQDEIGTPLCVTVDFQTVEEDDAVTIRDRDTMEQVRVPISNLLSSLSDKLS